MQSSHEFINRCEKSVTQYKDNPVILAELNIKLASLASYYLGQLESITMNKSQEWINIKYSEPDKLSDKLTEMKWQTTDQGKLEIHTTITLKRIDKLQSAISKLLYELDRERRRTGI